MRSCILVISLLINISFLFSSPCFSSHLYLEEVYGSELRKRNTRDVKHTNEGKYIHKVVTTEGNSGSPIGTIKEEFVETRRNNFSVDEMTEIDLSNEDLEKTLKYYKESGEFEELQKKIYSNALKRKGNSSYILGFIYEKNIADCYTDLDRNYAKKNAVYWYTNSFLGNNSLRDYNAQKAIERIISAF